MIVKTGANLHKKSFGDSPNGYKYASYVAQTVARLLEVVIFLEGGEGLACVVIEEAAIEPAFDYIVSKGVLLREPPEEACDVVVAFEFCNEFASELCLSFNADGVEFGKLIWS